MAGRTDLFAGERWRPKSLAWGRLSAVAPAPVDRATRPSACTLAPSLRGGCVFCLPARRHGSPGIRRAAPVVRRARPVFCCATPVFRGATPVFCRARAPRRGKKGPLRHKKGPRRGEMGPLRVHWVPKTRRIPGIRRAPPPWQRQNRDRPGTGGRAGRGPGRAGGRPGLAAVRAAEVARQGTRGLLPNIALARATRRAVDGTARGIASGGMHGFAGAAR